jgi:hypothetical protein
MTWLQAQGLFERKVWKPEEDPWGEEAHKKDPLLYLRQLPWEFLMELCWDNKWPCEQTPGSFVVYLPEGRYVLTKEECPYMRRSRATIPAPRRVVGERRPFCAIRKGFIPDRVIFSRYWG